MIVVLLCLWCSALLGYGLRRYPQLWVGGLTTYIVWLMLWLLGVEVGRNPQLVNSLDRLGVEALIGAVAAVAGSGVASLVLWKGLRRKRVLLSGQEEEPASGGSVWWQMKDSLIIVVFFAAGCLCGYGAYVPAIPDEASFYTLCVLMGCVGFSVGQSAEVRQNIRRLDRRLMWLPVLTVFGTLIGVTVVALFISRYSVFDWLAVGSGFGYYSLSSILVTEAKGSELGTLALMINIVREIITLVAAPLLYRWLGPLSPIAAGGCTTGDTTLPVISGVCGKEFVPLSIFHGLTIDFMVPFLVSFFCAI